MISVTSPKEVMWLIQFVWLHDYSKCYKWICILLEGGQGPNEKLLTFGNAQDPGLFGRILYRSTLDHIFINTYRIELRKKWETLSWCYQENITKHFAATYPSVIRFTWRKFLVLVELWSLQLLLLQCALNKMYSFFQMLCFKTHWGFYVMHACLKTLSSLCN